MWRSAGQIPQWLHWNFFTAACIAYTLYSLCLDYESAWYGRGFHGNVVDRFKGRTHISSWSNTRGKLHKLCKEDLKRPGTEVLVVWLGQAGVPLLAKIITKRSSIIVLNVHTPVDQLRERSYGTDELYAILQPLIFMLHLNDELCCCLNCFEILSASFSAIPVAQLWKQNANLPFTDGKPLLLS